jgi:hypothetical protein
MVPVPADDFKVRRGDDDETPDRPGIPGPPELRSESLFRSKKCAPPSSNGHLASKRSSARAVTVSFDLGVQDGASFRWARPRRRSGESVQTRSAADLRIDASHAERARPIAWLLAACLAAMPLAAPVAAKPENPGATAPYFDRGDADVYLVPVGACSKETLVLLADYYENDLGIRMGIAPALPYREGLYNAQRKQLASESVLAWMMTKFETHSTNANAVFIGVTHNDIYSVTSRRPFTFEQRVPPHYALVSSHRTTREPTGDISQITEVQPNLRKLVTKTIGALLLGRSESTDPRNVMYGPVRTLDELEAIDESTTRSALTE